MSGVRPSDAIEETAEATAEHAAAEGVDAGETEGMGSSSTLRDMLMSTEPNTPLERVESPFDAEAGGVSRIFRGIQKMIGVGDLPALLDILIGIAEFVVGRDLGGDGDDQDSDSVDVEFGGEEP